MIFLLMKKLQVLVYKEYFVLKPLHLLYYTVDETNNDEYNDPPDIDTVSGMYLCFMYK